MTEIMNGIYKQTLKDSTGTAQISIFLIPGKPGERCLMIDAGYRTEENKEKMTAVLQELGIRFEDLDIFLTHKHHDHTGLAAFYAHRGARIFMNPEENRHPYDCLYYNNSSAAMEEQTSVLRRVGVTKERTPQLWERFMQINREVHESQKELMFRENQNYEHLPIESGQLFSYGDYTLRAFPLRGHTYGQMGLADENHKIVFAADQIIDGIVPIVGTAYPDEHLLHAYFESLEDFKERFRGYQVHPAHGDSHLCVGDVIDGIILAYQQKLERMLRIIDEQEHLQTVKEIAFLAYGITEHMEQEKMMKLKMIITKTFACLEYMFDEGLINRTEVAGSLFWGKK
jgi:glyoxylase-like metal-dependent hydrolase (beta-lactamase superfamily II)